MFKKGVVFLILTSMMLHCASRMGFLSYLYAQRHDIAYTLGLIAEVPIALCSSDHDLNDGLTIHSADEDGATTTQRSLPVAQEINLFFVYAKTQVPNLKEIRMEKAYASLWSKPLNGCLQSVFHPPAQPS